MKGAQRNMVTLLIEDNQADVFLSRAAIEFHKFPLNRHVVDDGDPAFQFLERAETAAVHAACPALVLLDLDLSSGME